MLGRTDSITSKKAKPVSPSALMRMFPLPAASWCGLSSTAGGGGWCTCWAPSGPEGKSEQLAPEEWSCSGVPARCCQQASTGSRLHTEGPDR